MLSVDVSDSKTLCIGIEFAWWGGLGRGSPESCADVIVGQKVDSPRPWYRVVDLHVAPNPSAQDPCQANYDADASVLIDYLRKELKRLEETGARRFILAIDAPIATNQVGHPPRRRVLKKGEKGAITRRSCECRFLETVKELGGPWGQGVSAQPGAPLAPRVVQFMDKLSSELGFVRWDASCQGDLPERVVIEVLPAEAIWALGVIGAYGDKGSETVGRYRKCERCVVSRDDATTWASWPLSGFAPILGDVCDVSASIETIAGWVSDTRSTNGNLKLTKRYSGLVNAGLAWLTALSFRQGRYHWFAGADLDGCIVGPGKIPELTAR
jgi:hypothetical protein